MERIDIVITGPHIALPTKEFLAGQVLRVDRPKPHEIKDVVVKRDKWGVTYRLSVVRDPCPVKYFGGPVCPLCRKAH